MMFQAQSILAMLLLAVVAVSAISKKSDDNGPMPSQPVYQGGSGNNGQYSMPGQYGQSHEHQAQNSGSQSNLYYYYYPVQDKPKDGPYHQANNAPMNHQQSSPSSSSHDNVDNHGGQMDAQASGSEISYSSPAELSHDYPSQTQGFDAQTLSNLASQFQQQYFNNPSQSYDNAAAAAAGLAGYVPQAEASGHIASQVHPGYNGPMGPQSHLAFAQGSPYGGQNVFGFGGGGAGAGGAIQPQSNEVGSSITSGLKKYGLSSILMPVLAIAGLSLLLPTVTSLGTTTTKTKRSIEDSPFSSYIEKMDAYYKMYNKALEKEECMNRMICELGDAVSDVRGRSALLMVVENLAPQWMEKKMSVFKNGALSKDTSKCKKYSC